MLEHSIAFFDTKSYDKNFFDKYNKEYNFKCKYFTPHLNADTVKLVDKGDIVCIFVNDVVDAKVVESLQAKEVKLIALRCAGYNNIDLKAIYKKINVVRVPAYSPYSVAEHAVALMLTLNRKTHKAYYRTREGNFSLGGLLGFDMQAKIAGVIGTGKIGRSLINILKGLGMQVLVYDSYPDENYAEKLGIKYVSLEEVYKYSDVISLHCPLTPQTQHLINEQSISKMKTGVMLINTGRGALINTTALIAGLKSGHIGAAGLDVYEEEGEYFFEDFSHKVIADDVLARLLSFPNVLVTSHQAFFTQEAMSNIVQTTLENIKDFVNKGYLPNEVCYRCEAGESCRKKQKQKCF